MHCPLRGKSKDAVVHWLSSAFCRFIYNLVSKAKYSDKGDYELLRQSLVAMRDHVKANNVKKIGKDH